MVKNYKKLHSNIDLQRLLYFYNMMIMYIQNYLQDLLKPCTEYRP